MQAGSLHSEPPHLLKQDATTTAMLADFLTGFLKTPEINYQTILHLIRIENVVEIDGYGRSGDEEVGHRKILEQ